MMSRAVKTCLYPVIAACTVWLAPAASAEPPPPPSEPTAEPAILYRRIFVPADNMAAWPRDNEKLLPIEAQEFDARVRAANREAAGDGAAATIHKAEYSARLEGDRLVDGRGSWTIAVHGDRRVVAGLTTEPPRALFGDPRTTAIAVHGDHPDGSARPAFLHLGDMSLVLREPRWQDGRHGDQQPARLGVWAHDGRPAEERALEVPAPGVLEFAWHVQSKPRHDGIEISWRLPIATSTRVLLDLPEGKEPRVDDGVVVASRPLSQTTAPASAPRRQWELALTPTSGTTLRIIDADAGVADPSTVVAGPPTEPRRAGSGDPRTTGTDRRQPTADSQQPALTLHDHLSYRVTQRGVAIEATWRLHDSNAERRELHIPLPPGVQLMSISADSRELPWRMVNRASDQVSLVDVSEIAAPGPVAIVLRAWHPLVLDRPWKLPKLRPEGVYWTSGTIELSIDEQLEVAELTSPDYVQTSMSLGDPSQSGPETWRLSAYSPAAELEVALARRHPIALARLASSFALADPDVNGRLVGEWTVSQGSIHHLSGILQSGWIIGAVETIPAEALGEWFIDRHDGEERLEIQLARTVSRERPVKVVITGRLQRADPFGPISAAALRMVQWQNARVARHVLAFHATEPYDAEPLGQLPQVPSEAIDAPERELLGTTADDGPVFDLSRAAEGAALRLTPKRGQYEAEIRLDATYAGGELFETRHLAITPTKNRVDRLLVYSTAPLGDAVAWFETATGAPLSAERLPADDPRLSTLPTGGELWRIRLRRPTSRPLEVTAKRSTSWPPVVAGLPTEPHRAGSGDPRTTGSSTPWPERSRLPLLALPEASQQRGRVLVRGDIAGLPPLEPREMQAIPLPVDGSQSPPFAAPRSSPPVRAAYRYDPADCLADRRHPELWIGTATASDVPSLIARRVELESFYWADGRGTHRATYHLEHEGASGFDLGLPDTAELKAVAVDGRPIELPGVDEAGRASVPLADSPRAQVVSVYFETHQPPLAAGSKLQPPLLQNDAPVLAGQWRIWLPDEFSTGRSDGSASEEGLNWRARLFGPLGRPLGARPFHPLRAADWTMLATAADGAESGRGKGEGGGRKGEGRRLTADGSSADGAEPPPAGWQAYHRRFVAGGPPTVIVAHPPAISAWALAAFLLCLVGGGIFSRRRRSAAGARGQLGLLSVAAGLCLLLPEAFAPLATGAFLGLLFSWLVPGSQALGFPPAAPDGPERGWSRLSTVSALGLVMIIAWAKVAWAEPTVRAAAAPNAPPSQTIHRLFVPVDTQRRPTGDKVYVSEPFLRELLRSAPEVAAATGGDWLLHDAHYTGELVGRSEERGARSEESVVAGDWTLAFDIELLTRDTTVVLPLVRDEAVWPTTAMLDGVPLPLVWRDQGQGCAVEIAEPGRYWLTITCAPRTTAAQGRNLLKLTIPPLRGARLQLNHPASITAPEVSGSSPPDNAGGSTPREMTTTAVRDYELDDTGQLIVAWPRSDPSGGAPGLRVTGVRWLRIGTTEVELETKYIVEGSAARPEALTIAFDRRWELVPGGVQGSGFGVQGLGAVENQSATRRLVRVPLPAGDLDRQEVTVRWRLHREALSRQPSAVSADGSTDGRRLTADGSSAPPPAEGHGSPPPTLGRLRLPPIELVSVPVTQRWLAVSADPSLECEVVGGSPSTGTAGDFLAIWGPGGSQPAAQDAPQLVLANIEATADWTIAVRPRRTAVAVDEVLHLAVGRDAVRVLYQADVTSGKVYEYQFPLEVPADLSIDDIVVLTKDGRQIVTRWARVGENRVNLFFGEQVANGYRLVLRGRVPMHQRSRRTLPLVAAGRQASSPRVQLYRDEDVLVEVRGIHAGASTLLRPVLPADAAPVIARSEERGARSEMELPPSDVQRAPWTARPIAAYRLDKTAADQVKLLVTPNKVELSGQTLTSLSREPDTWWTAFTCRLVVERGQLDTLRLRVPATWAGPFTVQSDVPASIKLTPEDAQHAVLSVRFGQPIAKGSKTGVSIRGPLSSPAIVSVPDIQVESMVRTTRFLQVPTVLEGQPVSWRQLGVRRAEVPGNLADHVAMPARPTAAPQDESEVSHPTDLATPSRSFEIVGAPFRLALQPASRRGDQAARVRLADTVIRVGPLGEQLVVTRLVVVPHGLVECTLRLPSDQELVSVHLDGHAALVHRGERGAGGGEQEGLSALGYQLPAKHPGPRPIADSRELAHSPLPAPRSPRFRDWQVPLGPTQLPRVLEIVSRSTSAGDQGCRIELRRPVLLAEERGARSEERGARIMAGGAARQPIPVDPVEVTLWSFGHPWPSARPRVEGARAVTAVEQAASRLDRLVSIAKAATPAAMELPPPDGHDWFRAWASLLSELRQEALSAASQGRRGDQRALVQVSGASDDALTQALERLDEWYEQWGARSEERGVLSRQPSAVSALSRRLTADGSIEAHGAEHWIYFVADGRPEQLTIELEGTRATPRQVRAIGLLAIVGLAVASLLLIGRPGSATRGTLAGDFLHRWPHAGGFLMGIAYWAWLWPSWLGILIALGSLLLAVRVGWPGRSFPLDASTVVRS